MTLMLLRSIVAVAVGAGSLFAASSDVVGTWRGSSVCADARPACHDESVVYYIRDVPDHPELVVIRADKIVDGKAITMGTGQWQYSRTRQTLEWRMPQQVWLFTVDGKRIDGTLTLADGTVVRKMSLQKDQ